MYKKLGTLPLVDLLTLLERKAPDLFKEIKSAKSHRQKIHLSQSLAQRIDDFLVAQEPSEPDRFREESAALAVSERKRIQTERDHQAALSRLQQYADEQGLAETPENAALVQQWLDQNAKGYWSRVGVDAAIDVLRSQLRWNPKPAVLPATQQQTATYWRPGDDLPDNATEAMLRRSPIEQVIAWRERQRLLGRDNLNRRKPQGSIASKF